MSHHRAGRLAEAEAIYRQILVQVPSHAEAIHLLGALASQTNRSAMAIELISRAIEIKPSPIEAYRNLAVVLSENARLDEAIALLRRAIVVQPGYAERAQQPGGRVGGNW